MAIKDLFSSERGFLVLLLIVAATVLTALRIMSIDQWQSFATWVFGIYVGGKTITGAVTIAANAKYPAPAEALKTAETPKAAA